MLQTMGVCDNGQSQLFNVIYTSLNAKNNNQEVILWQKKQEANG